MRHDRQHAKQGTVCRESGRRRGAGFTTRSNSGSGRESTPFSTVTPHHSERLPGMKTAQDQMMIEISLLSVEILVALCIH
jgi:hypothetical protein